MSSLSAASARGARARVRDAPRAFQNVRDDVRDARRARRRPASRAMQTLERAMQTLERADVLKSSARDEALARFAVTVTPSARRGRRALAAHERAHACGIDGCDKAYGSASSLCAHRRARHAGRDGRAARAARRRSDVADDADDADDADVVNDADGGVSSGEDASEDATTRAARKRGASGLSAGARETPLGTYLEIVAADAHGRLSAGARMKANVSRAVKEARVAASDARAPVHGRAAAAAAARVFASVESAAAREHRAIGAWLHALERVSRAASAALDDADGRVVDFPALDVRAAAAATARGRVADVPPPDLRADAAADVAARVEFAVARDLARAFTSSARHAP